MRKGSKLEAIRVAMKIYVEVKRGRGRPKKGWMLRIENDAKYNWCK